MGFSNQQPSPTQALAAPPRRGLRGSGFTLVEMLLVVAIIVILIAMLLPSLQWSREYARRDLCLANLHHIGQTASSYAVDNAQYLPSSAGHAGNWLWDLNSSTARLLIDRGGLPRGVFTCPSNPALAHNDFWFGGPFDQNGYLISGYHWLIRHPGAGGALAGGPPLFNSKQWKKRIATQYADDGALVFDPVVNLSGSWVSFGHLKAGNTSHVGAFGKPAGGNILRMHGGAAWRDFSQMTFNAQYGPQSYW